MEISPFLTEIARDYNRHIEHVAFEDLTFLKDRPLGVAWQKRPQNFFIDIDRDRLLCPHQVLFVFYHELGHIQQYHLGYRHFMGGKSEHEMEADAWAFKEMKMINDLGQVKPECRICFRCMKARSRVCLKKIMWRYPPTAARSRVPVSASGTLSVFQDGH